MHIQTMTQKRPVKTFTPQADLWHRDNPQQSKKPKSKTITTTTKKHTEERETDFQSYHTVRFKCVVFNNKKITKHAKKQENMTQRKKISSETAPEKSLMTDKPDKDFKATVIKMLEELK